jgi:hypothetical protein
MVRPMASNVSALSGFVANGHQTVHHVSASPPYDPGRSDLPSPVLTLAFPPTAFPIRRKLKCWSISTPHRSGLHVRLDLTTGYGFPALPGSVSGLHLPQTRQAPSAPLHGTRCYLLPSECRALRRQALPYRPRSYGLMRQSYPLPAPQYDPWARRLCRLLPAPLGVGPSRRYLCESFLACLDPYPGGPQGAFPRFFLPGIGLPRSCSGSALNAFLDSHFRPGSLFGAVASSFCSGPPVCSPPRWIPPSRPLGPGAAVASTSEHPAVRYLSTVRIC